MATTRRSSRKTTRPRRSSVDRLPFKLYVGQRNKLWAAFAESSDAVSYAESLRDEFRALARKTRSKGVPEIKILGPNRFRAGVF